MKKNHVNNAYRLTVPQGVADHTASLVHAFANELLLSFAAAPDQPTAPDHLRAAFREKLSTADRVAVTPLEIGRLCVALWYAAAETVATTALVPAGSVEASAQSGSAEQLPEAASAEPQPDPVGAVGVTYPTDLTPDLAEALALEYGQLLEIADRLRMRDETIPNDPPSAGAHALHFIIPFAIRDGERWKQTAREALPPVKRRT